MAKYKVTAVAMNRKTRETTLQRPSGDVMRDEVINTKTNILFKGALGPREVEIAYEAFWNELNPRSSEIVKVIGVKLIKGD
jgi:hypothetical protein